VETICSYIDPGATVCTPRGPRCLLCPWKDACAGHDAAFWITRPDGAVLLRRRPEKGLLGGMIEIPSTEWQEGALPTLAKARKDAPLQALAWKELPGNVTHTFTHFHLELRIIAGRVGRNAGPNALWRHPDEFAELALPTVMKKVARHALKYG
jgi:A/G-specific adenine glycosylase